MNAELLLAHYDRISDAPDAVARLRKFILDLAVRGKLLKQDSKEEPAADLLKRIQKEKTQLVKDGELKKFDLAPLPLNKDFPFPLPPRWAASDLQSLCISVTDGDHLPPPKQGHGIPLLVIGNIRDHSLSFEGCRHVSLQYYNALDSIRKPRKRDILYSLVGSYGIPVLINDDRQFCVQRHIGILRPSRSVNAIFLARVLKSKWVLDQATTFATGIAQKTVALSGLRKILIPLPPFAEQHRIVAKLDHLMGVCDRLEAAQNERETRRDQLTASAHHHLSNGEDAEELRTHAQFFIDHLSRLTKRPDQIKQLRQTILNLAVHGKLVPISPLESLSPLLVKRINQSEINPAPFTIPATWMWAKVNHIADTRLGKMLDKAKNIGNPHRYLRNINVRWFDFDLSDLYEMRFRDDELEEYSLRSGDVLICEGGEPGRAAVWDSREKNVYFQKAIHRVRFSKGVNPYFFLNTLRESVDSGRLSDYFTGVGIKHFTGRGLSSFSFPLPPLAEQQRIVAKVDELMAFCDKLEASLSTAQTETSRLLESVLHHALEASA